MLSLKHGKDSVNAQETHAYRHTYTHIHIYIKTGDTVDCCETIDL